MLKISIITINLNNLEGLKKTMQSVFDHTFSDYEYFIIGGGSNDSNKELIENHAHKLVYWVSEKDKGVYNAINKGIKKANGNYLLPFGYDTWGKYELEFWKDFIPHNLKVNIS